MRVSQTLPPHLPHPFDWKPQRKKENRLLKIAVVSGAWWPKPVIPLLGLL